MPAGWGAGEGMHLSSWDMYTRLVVSVCYGWLLGRVRVIFDLQETQRYTLLMLTAQRDRHNNRITSEQTPQLK